MRRALLWFGAAALLGGCGHGAPVVDGASLRASALRQHLAAQAPPAQERARTRAAWIRRFYERRGYTPAWIGSHGVQGRTDVLLTQLDGAADHGLDPRVYGADVLRAAVTALRAGGASPARAAALDVGLTAAFLALADDLRRGAVTPEVASPSWEVLRAPADLSGLLETAIALDAVSDNLQRLGPGTNAYERLQRALARSRQGGAEAEADRLRANLERWRWLPRDLGEDYLLVRIADFELDAVIDGRRGTHRVIVGEPFRQTPQFASVIHEVVVHPSWYVPPRIADEELAARLRADPQALAAAGFEVWSHGGTRVEAPAAAAALAELPDSLFSTRFRFVQRPGGSNPLGRVKLDLRNPFAVYLHDTPAAALFSRADRDLSHGCIRVQGAVDLARQMLGTSPARQRFEELLAAGQTGRVTLPEPVATYVLYWTASVTPDGRVRWADDLYDVDARLLTALAATVGARPWIDRVTSPATRASMAQEGTR